MFAFTPEQRAQLEAVLTPGARRAAQADLTAHGAHLDARERGEAFEGIVAMRLASALDTLEAGHRQYHAARDVAQQQRPAPPPLR